MHELFEGLFKAIGEAGIGLTSSDDRPLSIRQWAARVMLLIIMAVFAGIMVLGMATSPQP